VPADGAKKDEAAQNLVLLRGKEERYSLVSTAIIGQGRLAGQ
jgi:hypothetical protein